MMKIAAYYSHLNGYEWLQYHKRDLWLELSSTIEAIDASTLRTKVSKERGQQGRMLYSPTDLNSTFLRELNKLGWKENRVQSWQTGIDAKSRKNGVTQAITCMNVRTGLRSGQPANCYSMR